MHLSAKSRSQRLEVYEVKPNCTESRTFAAQTVFATAAITGLFFTYKHLLDCFLPNCTVFLRALWITRHFFNGGNCVYFSIFIKFFVYFFDYNRILFIKIKSNYLIMYTIVRRGPCVDTTHWRRNDTEWKTCWIYTKKIRNKMYRSKIEIY